MICLTNTDTTTTTTMAPTVDNCKQNIMIDGCTTGSAAKGGAIIDVASCQNYCKSVPGASHFNLRTSSPPFECHCKSCSGSQKGNIGFVSGKITCTGKMLYLLVRNPFYIMIISLSLYSINISNYHNHHHYFYHHQRGTRFVPTEVSGECKSNCTKDGYHKCFGNIGHSKSDNYHWQLKRSVFLQLQ